MSALSELEDALVARLEDAMYGGEPAFATVQGVSGGNRVALRAALRRERMPAAYVAWLRENAAAEGGAARRGSEFAVLVAERVLRLGSDPRHGDGSSIGVFALLEVVRGRLDDYEPRAGLRLTWRYARFIEADDRVAVYELGYRAAPVDDQRLTFAGESLAGAASRMTLSAGPLELEEDAEGDRGSPPARPRRIYWRGRLRAASQAALNAVEAAIETAVLEQARGDIAVAQVRVFANCILTRYTPSGGRRLEDDGRTVSQEAELLFLQPNPTPARHGG